MCALLVLTVTAQPRNVIFDTDVGTDFDDSASIALALQNPNITVRISSIMGSMDADCMM